MAVLDDSWGVLRRTRIRELEAAEKELERLREERQAVCEEPLCALPRGHGGFHVPLPILWQEAGYQGGPWAAVDDLSGGQEHDA